MLYFVAISTFITHFTFTSSEFHYSPANYNKKMYYKQNEKHLQHSAANKKHRIILSKEIRMKTSKRRRSEKKRHRGNIQKYEIPSICTLFCMGMTSMHRREKRSSFCSLIDIFFKIDIILVRIYHRRVLKLAGSSWCGKSRYGEAYHPIWEPGKIFSTETIWRSFEGKKRKEVGTTKSHGKALSMEMKNSQASKSNYMKITIKRKKEWISFFSPDKSGFFPSFSMTDCCRYY